MMNNKNLNFSKSEWFIIILMVENIFVSLLANYSIYFYPPNIILLSYVPTIILMFYCILFNKSFIKRNNNIAILYIISYIFIYLFSFLITGYFQSALILYLFWSTLFILLSDKIKIGIFELFINILAFVLLLSVIEYILYNVFNFYVVQEYVTRKIGTLREYYFIHLLFNLIDINANIPRFQCLMEEPGMLGTLCIFLLFPTNSKSKYKFHFFIFLASGLLSFSLGFYVLLLIYSLTLLLQIKKIVKYILIVAIIGYCGYSNFGEAFNTLIFERSQRDDVDNRYSQQFEKDFDHHLLTGALFFPQGGVQKYVIGGGMAGGKVWIWKYGLFAFIIVFIIYNKLVLSNNPSNVNKKILYMFLLTFWISYYQRDTIYTPYTMVIVATLPLLALKDDK